MVEINLQQLRDHLSVFEPGYPLHKGYVAQLLFQHSLSDVIKQVKAIVTAAEPNKNLHEGSLRGRLSVFKKFIASNKNRLLTEWPKHIALLLESFHITFKCPTLSPALKSTPSAATSSEHPEQTSTQIPVKLKHFSQTLDTQIHSDLPQTPDTLIHSDFPQTPDTLIHSNLPQTPDTPIHSDLPQTPDTLIQPDLPQTPDTLIQSDNLQTSTPTQTAPPTQTPLPINSQSYSATCSSQSPIKLKNSCASCFTKQCTNINMMQENERLRHQLKDLKMLLRAEKKHLSLKRLNEKIRRETESMIWRNKYITLKASNDAQKLLDSVYSLEQKVKTLEENLIATQEESLNMTSVIEQLKSMHEKTENNDSHLKYVSSYSPSHNAYTHTDVEENKTIEYNSQSSVCYREGALFDRASKDLIIKTKNMVEDVSCTQDVRSEEENSHTQTEAAESDIIMDYPVVMAGIKNNPNDECSEELQQGRSSKLLEQGLPACQKTTQQNVSNIAISSMNSLEEILASQKSCRLSALHVSKPCTIGNKFDSSGRTFKENIFQNRQTHAKDNLYKCDVCDRQFAKNMYLKIHKNTCSRDKPFKCDICGREFLMEGYLRIHTRTHTGEKPYKCDICGNAFAWSRHRDAHQKSHIIEKPFQCDVCGLCCAQKYSLKIHTRTHSRTLKCKVCGLEFVKADMEKHKEVHKGEKNCVCNSCGKRFKTKSLLKSHTRIHSRIPFKCKVCGLEFEKKAGMKKHKEVHAYNHTDVAENGTVVYNSQSSVCYREDVLSDEASHDLLINPKNMVEDVCYTHDVRSQEEKTTHTHTEAVESVMIMDYQDMMAGIENDPDDECSEDLHQGRSSKLLEQRLSACQKTTQQNVSNIAISSMNSLEEILSSHTSCQPSVLHVGEHHTIGNKCDASGPTFKENIFQKHRPKHAKYKLYKCAVCGRRFAKDSLLKIHKRAHTKDKSYRCNISGHGFSVKENLRMHTRTYTGEKPYKCDVCGLTFSESGDRDVHKQSHAGDRPYKCDFCGLCFTQKYSLEIHTRTHSITQLKCKVCGREFEEKADMRKHKEVHKGEKNCVCDICGQRFKTKSLLTSHTRKHTGEKPYHCEVCGKSFAHNNAFKSHIRIHTEERPYKCDICGFAFRQSSSLSSHKLIHTGEKPYVCDICGFQVNRKDNLRLHKRVHQKKT